MARMYFTGGVMPSHDLLGRVPSPFDLETSTWYPGVHYRRTLEAWLARLDQQRDEAIAALHGSAVWMQRWRMFLMACSELFGFDGGREWGVSHHLLLQ